MWVAVKQAHDDLLQVPGGDVLVFVLVLIPAATVTAAVVVFIFVSVFLLVFVSVFICTLLIGPHTEIGNAPSAICKRAIIQTGKSVHNRNSDTTKGNILNITNSIHGKEYVIWYIKLVKHHL